MHAQIAGTLRHLKQALTHLHDARLLIEGIDKTAAITIEHLIRAVREQVKGLEQANDRQG